MEFPIKDSKAFIAVGVAAMSAAAAALALKKHWIHRSLRDRPGVVAKGESPLGDDQPVSGGGAGYLPSPTLWRHVRVRTDCGVRRRGPMAQGSSRLAARQKEDSGERLLFESVGCVAKVNMQPAASTLDAETELPDVSCIEEDGDVDMISREMTLSKTYNDMLEMSMEEDGWVLVHHDTMTGRVNLSSALDEHLKKHTELFSEVSGLAGSVYQLVGEPSGTHRAKDVHS